MAGGVIGYQHERIGHFTLVFENINAARAHHTGRELRLAPADLERCHHVIEQGSGDAAGIIPVLAEAEEAVGVEGPFGRRAQPHLPVAVVVTLAVRAGFGVASPGPLPFAGVAMEWTLA